MRGVYQQRLLSAAEAIPQQVCVYHLASQAHFLDSGGARAYALAPLALDLPRLMDLPAGRSSRVRPIKESTSYD